LENVGGGISERLKAHGPRRREKKIARAHGTDYSLRARFALRLAAPHIRGTFSDTLLFHVRISCNINTRYEIAKQMRVMAIRAVM
jgi:hypothetical protein